MEEKFVLISLKHTDFSSSPAILKFWGPDFSGYTVDYEEAGKYSFESIKQKTCNLGKYYVFNHEVDSSGYLRADYETLVISESDIENLFKPKRVVLF